MKGIMKSELLSVKFLGEKIFASFRSTVTRESNDSQREVVNYATQGFDPKVNSAEKYARSVSEKRELKLAKSKHKVFLVENPDLYAREQNSLLQNIISAKVPRYGSLIINNITIV